MEWTGLELLESAGDGVFLLNAEGHILYATARLAEMLDRTTKELTGCALSSLLSPQWLSRATHALDRILAGESPLRLDLEMQDRHGHPIPVELTLSVVKRGDCVSGAMGITRDAGEQRALEARLIQYSEEARRKEEEMATIANIGLAITRSFNLVEVLRLIYVQLLPVIDFSAFTIGLIDTQRDEISFEFVAEHREPRPPFRRRLDESAGLCGWVVRQSRPLLIGDWQKERNSFQQRGWEYLQQPLLLPDDWKDERDDHVVEPVLLPDSVASWLGAPLIARERTIGVIALFNETANAYDERHQRLLWAIADQAAMAIDNARLYEEQRRRASQLEAVREITQRIAPMLSLSELLDQVVTQIQTRFGYDHVHIFLVDGQDGSYLRFHAGTGPAAATMRLNRLCVSIGREGIVSWVAATGEPVICNDVTTDPRYRFFKPLEATRSEISVPLSYGEWVLGVLDVQSQRQDAFDESDLFVLQSLADLVAISIENCYLFGERERRIQELTTLNNIAETIVSSLDFDQTLTAIMERVNEIFKVEAGSLLLLEEGRLVFRVTLSPKAELIKSHTLAVGQGIAGWVAQNGLPLLVPNARSDPRWYPDIDASTAFETRSILCVPMKAKDEVVGVIELINPLDGREFTQDDLGLMEAIATSAVIAIKNARLHQQTQHRLEEVSTLYTLANQMTSSLDVPVVLDAIVNILKRVLNCRGCCIFLLNPKTQMLEIKASAGMALRESQALRIAIGEGVIGRVVQSATPINLPDRRQEPHMKHFDPQVRSLLVVPLITKDRVIGTLSVDDLKVGAFGEDVGRLLIIAAAQAAAHIENAQLYEGLKERAKKLEEAYADLQEADRKKDEFVQNVSHELRHPLSFVKAYVELFLDGTLGPITDSQRESLEIVVQRTDAITNLVNDILTLQQLDREHMTMKPTKIEHLVRSAVKTVEPTAAQMGLALRVVVEGSLPIVSVDPGRINQVMNNLLGNAVKFSPNGGTITVRVRQVADAVQVEVADEGIGIPASKLDKIFERFYQVDGSSRRRFPGTGLGLAIAKRIVEAHNGHIWVESQESQGSTFFFTLSTLPPEQAAAGV
ncbi:MAG: GAF domain-containing protein [Chloroflexota bacterium]